MARYKVQGPDGAIHVFEGPDGASQDMVLSFAAQHFGKPSAGAPMDPKQFGPDDPGAIMSTLIGAGWTFDRAIKGMQQIYHAARGNDAELAQLKSVADDDKKHYDQLAEKHPIATAIGETLPAAVIPVGGSATLAGTAGKLAMAGALPGAIQYGSAGDRAKGAAIGAIGAEVGGLAVPKAVEAAVKGIPAVGRAVRAAVEPLSASGRNTIAGRTLARAAGDDPAVVAKLAGAAPLVPGSIPTAAQVAENGGIAALERSTAAANPAPFTERAMEQSSARVQALRGIAKDAPAREAAVLARSAAADPLYAQAKGATYTMDDKLEALLQTPAMQQAMKRAESLAANNERTFTFEVPGHDVMSGLGNRSAGGSKQITGQGLQDLKMAVDDMLKDPASGFAGSEGQAVKALRGKLLNWMEARNPMYKEARTTYADMSKPIGQMDVGQQLLKDLEPALNDYGQLAHETGSKYATALRNADATAAKATKFRGQGMSDLMEPAQMDTLEGIASDLARKSNAQKLGREYGGSDTFQKLALSNIAEQSGAPGVVGGALNLPGVSKVAKFLYSGPEEKINSIIAQSLLEPKTAATLMQEAIAKGRPQPIGNILFANPSRPAQILGGASGMAATDLFAR